MVSLKEQREDFRIQLRKALQDNVSCLNILDLFDSMSFNIDETIQAIHDKLDMSELNYREVKEKLEASEVNYGEVKEKLEASEANYGEVKEKLEGTEVDYEEVKKKLEQADAKTNTVTQRLDVLGELTTVTIGINLAMQLTAYTEQNMGTRLPKEPTAIFQRRCGVLNFISYNLRIRPDAALERNLSDLRTKRNDRVHGLLSIVNTLLKYESQANLMTALRQENAFAASILDRAKPFVFFALAGEVIHFCKKQLLPEYAHWTPRAARKCVHALREHSSQFDELFSNSDDELLTIFDRFETRSTGKTKVTLQSCLDRHEILQSITLWTSTLQGMVSPSTMYSPGIPEVNDVIQNAAGLMFRSFECGPVHIAAPILRRLGQRLTRLSEQANLSIAGMSHE